MKGNEAIKILKVIYCMDFDEFARALGIDLSVEHEGYWLSKFGEVRNNLFNGVCMLDSEKQDLLWDYAKNKYKV
jgi:hypothetical protein